MLSDIRLSYAFAAAGVGLRALQTLGVTDALSPTGLNNSQFSTMVAALEHLVFVCNAAVAVAGTAVLLAFYYHTVLIVANRKPVWAWRPLYTYFQITKPLELLFRFATAPLRCLPDVCILGEVRCGTTTLAEHLQSMPGTHGPFCAFHHPLDGKESFYFVGHYFGLVHPYFYRAMFPLRATRWFHTAVLGQPFLVFDGCAQYLSSPFAPELLRAAVGPDVSLLVCLREPVAQNVSWWKFEHASMQWFDSMGIPQSIEGIGHVRVLYPPATYGAALDLSRSDAVSRLYDEAEQLPPTLPGRWWIVPKRFLTWPNGQLSAASRNGGYATNVQRWHRWFDKSRFEYFELSEHAAVELPNTLRKLCGRLPEAYLKRVSVEQIVTIAQHRHANPSSDSPTATVPTQRELDEATAFYAPHNEVLFELIGRRYPTWAHSKSSS